MITGTQLSNDDLERYFVSRKVQKLSKLDNSNVAKRIHNPAPKSPVGIYLGLVFIVIGSIKGETWKHQSSVQHAVTA